MLSTIDIANEFTDRNTNRKKERTCFPPLTSQTNLPTATQTERKNGHAFHHWHRKRIYRPQHKQKERTDMLSTIDIANEFTDRNTNRKKERTCFPPLTSQTNLPTATQTERKNGHAFHHWHRKRIYRPQHKQKERTDMLSTIDIANDLTDRNTNRKNGHAFHHWHRKRIYRPQHKQKERTCFPPLTSQTNLPTATQTERTDMLSTIDIANEFTDRNTNRKNGHAFHHWHRKRIYRPQHKQKERTCFPPLTSQTNLPTATQTERTDMLSTIDIANEFTDRNTNRKNGHAFHHWHRTDIANEFTPLTSQQKERTCFPPLTSQTNLPTATQTERTDMFCTIDIANEFTDRNTNRKNGHAFHHWHRKRIYRPQHKQKERTCFPPLTSQTNLPTATQTERTDMLSTIDIANEFTDRNTNRKNGHAFHHWHRKRIYRPQHKQKERTCFPPLTSQTNLPTATQTERTDMLSTIDIANEFTDRNTNRKNGHAFHHWHRKRIYRPQHKQKERTCFPPLTSQTNLPTATQTERTDMLSTIDIANEFTDRNTNRKNGHAFHHWHHKRIYRPQHKQKA